MTNVARRAPKMAPRMMAIRLTFSKFCRKEVGVGVAVLFGNVGTKMVGAKVGALQMLRPWK